LLIHQHFEESSHSASVWGQVEKEHNALLDASGRMRDDMGEVTDNVSLATALETLWASRLEQAASGEQVIPPRWHTLA
jgi:hypothetical protein